MESKRAEVIINIRWHADAKKAEFVIDDRVYPAAGELTAPLKYAKAIGEKKVPERESELPRADPRRPGCARPLYFQP